MSESRPAAGPVAWAGVVVLTACGMMSALLEALFVPYYVGSTLMPVTVLFALVGNVALPRLARSLVPRTIAALLPFLGWLIVMIGFGVIARPEGDVILPGAPSSVQWVVYGTLLGGALTGTITVVLGAPPPQRRRGG